MIPYAQLEADVFYLGRKGDVEAALSRIDDFAAAVQGDDRLRAALLRAQVYHTMGRYAEALALYREVLHDLPADPRSQAICLVEMLALANTTGDLELGESMAQQALALIRRRPEASVAQDRVYVGYAQLHYLRGDYAGAIDWYRRALRRLEDPTDPAVTENDRICGMAFCWYGLARCYIAHGDMVKARFAIEGIRCDARSRTVATLSALAEFRLHLRLLYLDLAEQWLANAEQHASDPELVQEILVGRAQLAHARGNFSAMRAITRQLQGIAAPLPYEARKALAALGAKASAT